jgi:hypothetical protein
MPDILLRIETGNRVNRPPLVCVICGEPTNQVQELKAGGTPVSIPFCHVHIDYTTLPFGLVFIPALLGLVIGGLILKIDRSPLILATGILIATVGCLGSFLIKIVLDRRFSLGVVAQHDSPQPTHVLLRGVCPAFAEAVEKDRNSSNPFASSDPSSDNPFQF